MEIQKMKLKDLKPATYNPRKDLQQGDPEYELIKKSILDNGLVQPIIWNKQTGNVCGGHQRLKIIKDLGYTDTEVVVIDVTETKEKSMNIMLNRAVGDWDDERLALILAEAKKNDWLDKTGFDEEDITELLDKIQGDEVKDGLTDPDDVPQQRETNIKVGDVFKCGNHRVMCGDATDKRQVELLMDGNKADMVFTDPPFEMEDMKYMDILINKTEGTILVMHSDKNIVRLASAYIEKFHYFLIHYYSFGFMRSNNTPQMAHHTIGVFGEHKFVNNMDGFKTVICEQMERNKLMPYQKKVEIPEKCIKHYSSEGIILDVFGGSGSTIIGCERLGRVCYTMELSPVNVQIILDRWSNFTGEKSQKLK